MTVRPGASERAPREFTIGDASFARGHVAGSAITIEGPDFRTVDLAAPDSYVARMSTMPPIPEGRHADGCAELRRDVASRCDEAHQTKTAYEVMVRHVRDLRRDLVAAQHQQSTAEAAAEPGSRRAEKAKARETYEGARRAADDPEALASVTAAWAQTVDRINRAAMIAQRELSKARARVSQLQALVREAERAEQQTRMRAETSEADCLEARVRLASCEEGDGVPADAAAADVSEPRADTAAQAVVISTNASRAPLVIESMVSGDGRALELAADQIAEHTGLAPAQARLQLQELVDAIVSVASAEGFLVFDTAHRFWSALSFEESRDVVSALARLGFQFEPSQGWHAGRSPSTLDLSMALAYAGLDPRNMRDLPSAEELRLLPQSISVDARALLAAQAPDLTVDHVVHLLERRAAQLEPLWDAWGQVRPILLSPRHELGSLTG